MVIVPAYWLAVVLHSEDDYSVSFFLILIYARTSIYFFLFCAINAAIRTPDRHALASSRTVRCGDCGTALSSMSAGRSLCVITSRRANLPFDVAR